MSIHRRSVPTSPAVFTFGALPSSDSPCFSTVKPPIFVEESIFRTFIPVYVSAEQPTLRFGFRDERAVIE